MTMVKKEFVPTIYELSRPGRKGIDLPDCDVPETSLPREHLRDTIDLPELSQLDTIRHFLHLSQRNHGVDCGFYPLGSCTMKYNPKILDQCAAFDGFRQSHPGSEEINVQGNLSVMHRLQEYLAAISGFTAVSLSPAAGAQGEMAGLLMIRACQADRGESHRNRILVPDSAHGTNPASTTMAGFSVVEIPTDGRGNIDLGALTAACDETVAGLMLTNPNTLGLFEQDILEVNRVVHACGGLVYGDGANMNALIGMVRPADLGIDLMHFNLHKTFATPHGGGGPGSGPVAASEELAAYLPGPVVERDDSEDGPALRWGFPRRSIGRLNSYHGNFSTVVRAFAYIALLGEEGLRNNARYAVLAANYLRCRLKDHLTVPYDRINMHEFVCRGEVADNPVRALDISKRLMDHGIHPPTNYFPTIVPEALMIEPTETESLETLDAFCEAMIGICDEARQDPDKVLQAPHQTPTGRLDEVKAARELILTCQDSMRRMRTFNDRPDAPEA